MRCIAHVIVVSGFTISLIFGLLLAVCNQIQPSLQTSCQSTNFPFPFSLQQTCFKCAQRMNTEEGGSGADDESESSDDEKRRLENIRYRTRLPWSCTCGKRYIRKSSLAYHKLRCHFAKMEVAALDQGANSGEDGYISDQFDQKWLYEVQLEERAHLEDEQNQPAERNVHQTAGPESLYYPFKNKETHVIVSMVMGGNPWSDEQIQKLLSSHHLPNFIHSNVPKSVYHFKKLVSQIPVYSEFKQMRMAKMEMSKIKRAARRGWSFNEASHRPHARHVELLAPTLRSIVAQHFASPSIM